jgi:hypothetical protein
VDRFAFVVSDGQRFVGLRFHEFGFEDIILLFILLVSERRRKEMERKREWGMEDQPWRAQK